MLEMQVAGTVPRVLSSVIGGPMGKMSKRITIQNILEIVTLHKLENLPPLPILGDFTNDRPNTFSFKVTALIDQPQAISQSIEKSFFWLPVIPNASAHPLPSLTFQ
jgi:hypothetical protein